jgi:hypothetical protein
MDSLQQAQAKFEAKVADARMAGTEGHGAPPRERHRGFKVYDRALATVTSLSVVAGGIWALYTYRVQREDETAQRRREYLLELHREKKEIYQPLCSAVGKIVSAKSLAEAQPSIDKFWELYFGEVHLVEDANVQQHKIAFGQALQGWQDRKDETPPTELLPLSGNLVQACQEAIALEKAYGISPNRDAGTGSAGPPTLAPADDAKNQ